MSDATKDIDQKLEEWAIPLRQMLEQEESALVDARAEVKRRESRIKRIERTLKSMEPEAAKPKPAKDRRASSNDWTPNVRALTAVREQFAAHPDGVTTRELVEATNLSSSTVNRAVTVLRASEEIRLAGRRDGRGRGGGAPIYKALVSDAVA